MSDMNMYGVEGNNESKNNEPGGSGDAADAIELLDVGVEVTGEVVEGMSKGTGLFDGDLWECLDDIPWGVIGAVLVAIGGIAVVIYKLVKRRKKK